MNETSPLSPTVFLWLLTAFVGTVSFAWIAHDSRNLIRSRTHDDRSDPLVRDRQFGYLMGIVMATVGAIGTIKFHL